MYSLCVSTGAATATGFWLVCNSRAVLTGVTGFSIFETEKNERRLQGALLAEDLTMRLLAAMLGLHDSTKKNFRRSLIESLRGC